MAYLREMSLGVAMPRVMISILPIDYCFYLISLMPMRVS
jgi:hypothetical protein